MVGYQNAMGNRKCKLYRYCKWGTSAVVGCANASHMEESCLGYVGS